MQVQLQLAKVLPFCKYQIGGPFTSLKEAHRQ